MLIINAKIITMENETIDNGYIVIKDNLIERIGYMEDLNVTSKRFIDAQGGLVLPGFIDPHCHIGMWDDGLGFEGDDGNEETDPITPHLRAIDAVNSFDDCFGEALDAGITTVLTGPGSANPIAGQWCAMKTRRDRIDNLIVASPVGMKFALGENPKTTYNAKNQSPVTRMATAALIREQLQKTKRYMEDMDRFHEDEELDEPEYDMKCEALVPVLKREIKAFFHAHRADDIFTAIRLAEEFNLDYVLVHATEAYKIAPQLQAVMPNIITGPIICDRSKPELKGLTPKNAGILRGVGIETAICTDHPVIPIQYLALSAAISAKEGLGATKALEAITITAAKMTGIDHRVGSIKVGKDADIIIFNKNPLDVMVLPTHVIIDGVLVKGQFNE
jgi:imidazolonepropionase-like amidohydrolase